MPGQGNLIHKFPLTPLPSISFPFSSTKPGLPYLDIVAKVKARFEVPVFAYQVSGEYAMIEAAVAAGAGERDALVLETLLAFKRAGCSGVLTYHAPLAARLLGA